MIRIRNLTVKKAEKILQSVGLDPFDKPVKYVLNRFQGMKKGEAMLKAGYADTSHISQIKITKGFKQATALLATKLPTAEELAVEHTKVIVQDADLPSKNRALDMAYRIKEEYPKQDVGDIESGDVIIKVSRKE